MRFSQFTLEHVRSKDGQVTFSDPPKTKEAASKDFLNTQLPKQLYVTAGEQTNQERVYSSFLYRSSDVNTDLLSSLKGQGPHAVDPVKLAEFIDRTASHAAPHLKRLVNPTVIIYPKSSSTFTRQVVDKLSERLGAKALTDVFVKRTFDLSGDKRQDLEAVEKAFIRREHPKYDTLSDESKKALLAGVYHKVKAGGSVSSKGLPKHLTKFVKNFVKLGDQDQAAQALGERVLLVDDVMSSGMTMRELMTLIRRDLEPTALAGYTVFKLTGGKDD